MKNIAVCIGIAVVLFGLPVAGYSASYTWDGGGGDFKWETTTNWNPDSPVGGPNASDASLTWGSSASAIYMPADNTARDVYGITIDSSSTGVQLAGSGTGSLNIYGGGVTIASEAGGGPYSYEIRPTGGINLMAEQTWTNNSSGNLINYLNPPGGYNSAIKNNGFKLTIAGSGTTDLRDVQGSGNIEKTGAGSLYVSGTYTGSTTVGGGKLYLTNTANSSSTFINSGTVIVESNLKNDSVLHVNFDGSGNDGVLTSEYDKTVGGVVIYDGGTVSPGGSGSTYTITSANNQTWYGGGTFLCTVSATDSDQLAVLGYTIDITNVGTNNTFKITVEGDPGSKTSWEIATCDSFTGNTFSRDLFTVTSGYEIDYVGTTLNLYAVPEPSVVNFFLLSLPVFGVFGFRRKNSPK